MKLYRVALCFVLCACADPPSVLEEPADPLADTQDAGPIVLGSRDASARATSDAKTPVSNVSEPTRDASSLPQAVAEHTNDAALETPLPSEEKATQGATLSGVVVGYYPAWATYDRDFQVSEIAAAKLTHINYAFANVVGGRCALGDAWADVQKTFAGDDWDESSQNRAGNFKQLRKLKETNPKLRTLISVGGWTWSAGFSDVALSADARRSFATSCVDFIIEHGFDGIDIDWEYPQGGGLDGNTARPEDKANYTLLLRALRSELSARQQTLGRSEPFLLTIAAPAGPSTIPHLEAQAISQVVDWINTMTYDFHGSWESRTGHNAPLRHAAGDSLVGYDATSAIDAYLAAGVPASRLTLGVPFYGRTFAGVPAGDSHGRNQSMTGAGPGTWEPGIVDYHDIVAHYLGRAGYTRYVDDSADVPYLFNATSGVFISYDDPDSLRKKRALITDKKLAGGMIWDLSSDAADHALLNALVGP